MLSYLDSLLNCPQCGNVREALGYCGYCEMENIVSKTTFRFLGEIDWSTDAKTADAVMRKHGFAHHNLYDYYQSNPLTIGGRTYIDCSYQGNSIFGTMSTGLGLSYSLDGKLEDLWVGFDEGSNFDMVLQSLIREYGSDYREAFYYYEDYEDDEAYIWQIDDAFVVLSSSDGLMENAKTHKSGYSVHFYKALPEEYYFQNP